MNTELKIGIVGFGGAGIALYHHFNAIKGCRVISVYDTKQAGLDRAAKLSKALNTTDNFTTFLDSNIDISVVTSPDRTHAEYIIKSLDAGKHVICEKPLTDSVEGYTDILQAEAKNSRGCVTAVQHQMRFLPVHLKMKELIKKGELGRISYIEGYYVHNLTERAKLYDDWRFEDNATPLVYSGCHFVDLLRWLLGDEVVEVSAMANNIGFPEYPESDLNVVLLRFKSGVIGKVVTAFGAGRPQDHSVRIYGAKKSIENNLLFSKDGRFSVFASPFMKEPLEDHSGIRTKLGAYRRNYKAVIYGKIFEKLMSSYNLFNNEYSIGSYPIRLYEHAFAVRESVSDFVSAIRAGGKPKCSLTDSAKTVATCLAGVEAYRTNKVVPLSKYWIKEFDR